MKSTTIPLTIASTAIATAIVLISFYKILLPAPIPGEPSQQPTKEITKAVADKLKVDGQDPAVVFSINRSGAVQAFRVEGTTSKIFKFPLPAGVIESMQTITIFETRNPKKCWINLNGALECIEW